MPRAGPGYQCFCIDCQCSLIENSAQLETVESLQELAIKCPYDVDCTWSDEAASLREIAVKTPDKLTEAFILKFFKSLRIVDKKVRSHD